MNRAKKVLVLILILAVVVPLATIAIPAPVEDTVLLKAKDFRLGVASTAFFAWLYVGAAILFIIGLDVFKERLQRAYAAICAGLVLYGISSVQVPFLVASGLLDSAWGLGGGVGVPFVAGGVLTFIGLRSFARALGDKSVWTSMAAVLGVTLVTSLLFGWLARDWSQLTFNNVSFAGNIASICLASANLVLAVHVRRLAGPAYTNALSWFMFALFATFCAQFPSPIGEVLNIPESSLLVIPLVISGALFIKAGYAFNKIREY